MSPVLLRLAPGPIERVNADVAVVPLFAAERPLRDTAGRVDWRLCGRLSQLLAAGRLRGERGEAVLIPGGGGVRAPLVLALGLGERAESGGSLGTRWADWTREALERIAALAVRRAALGIPTFAAALPERLAELAAAAGSCTGSFEVELAPEPVDRAAAAEWLRRVAQRRRTSAVEIQAPVEAAPPPRGGNFESAGPVKSR